MNSKKRSDSQATYQEFQSWEDHEKWELLDGVPHRLPLNISERHRRVAVGIVAQIYQKLRLEPSPYRIYRAPVECWLDDLNVVHPDIMVVRGAERVRGPNIRGAPEVIIQLLHPDRAVVDRGEKFQIYERFGVQQYILVQPTHEYAEDFRLLDGTYSGSQVYNWNESLPLLHPRMTIHLEQVFRGNDG